jgi:Phage derived protein Gp49-like (DUF891)
VKDSYDAGSKKLRAKFFSRIATLAQLEFLEWREPLFKTLHGECDGLGEIRFQADDVQQRPLGFRSGPMEFTIVFWAIEKEDKFVPRNACRRALERKSEILANRNRSDALWLALQ